MDNSTLSAHKTACIKDRYIASTIDFILLLAVFGLLLPPIRKYILMFKLTEQNEPLLITIFLVILISILLVFLYRTIFTIIKGGTPGKLMTGLQVVNIWSGQPLTVFHIIVREFFWLLSTSLLCIPHLAVFFHHQRRPIHDRIADSIVISTRGQFAQAPSFLTSIFGQSFILIFTCFIVFLFIFYPYNFIKQNIQKRNISKLLESNNLYCETVTDMESVWPYNEETEYPISRLEIALTLHGAHLIDNQCLDLEVQHAFYNNENLDLAYLANAFITSDDKPALSDEYLKKVCEISTDSTACQLSQIVTLWSQKKWEEASQKFRTLDYQKTKPFIKVWAIKHFERVKEFDAEEEVIQQLWHIKPLKEYLMSHRVAALWGLRKRKEALVAFQSAIQVLSTQDVLKLSSWYCLQQLKESCTDEIISNCQDFASTVRDNPLLLENNLYSLAYIKINICSQGDKLDYIAFENEMIEMPALQLVRGMRLLKERKIKEAKIVFKNLIQEQKTTSEKDYIQQNLIYFEEAKELLVSITDNRSDIEYLAEEWFKTDGSTWNSRTLGLMLFNKSFAMNDLILATRIGNQLFEMDPYNQKLKQNLIVASYKIGQEKEAWAVLKTIDDQNDNSYQPKSPYQNYQIYSAYPKRNIASSSLHKEFQDIQKILISKFGQQ